MLFIVDASVFVFRAYHSMPSDMTDRDGNPVHALFGFARFLADLIEQVRPEYMAVAFDQRLSRSFRSRIYPPYKANREPPPPDLARQIEKCREFCALAGVAAFGDDEYEADDLIGTLVCRMRREGIPSTLVTRDKDLAQLVREADVYWDYTAQLRFRYPDIEARFGVPPERMAEYLALCGDAVDNIRGVPGIGPKTAACLVRAFASLEQLFENLGELAKLKLRRAGELAAILVRHREAAFLARRLTAIVCDAPVVASPAALRRGLPDLPALEAFYARHDFGPVLRRQTDRLAELPFA